MLKERIEVWCAAIRIEVWFCVLSPWGIDDLAAVRLGELRKRR